MLKNTFHHIPGIGIKTERDLWDCGITDWQEMNGPAIEELPPKRLAALTRYVNESIEQMEKNNFKYFEDLLPSSLHWRFFPEFRKNTAYLDIETTGLEWFCETITTIAVYDGDEINYYVQGENLDDFPGDIKKYKVIVTYNGKCFDVPFIENYFHIKMDHVHIDLRYLLKSLGYGGGLKGCERKLGIDRGGLNGVDGYFAILLWNEFQRNDNPKALETLLAYNIEDVVNLETLMVMAYNMKLEGTPFRESHRMGLPSAPRVPFQAHSPTVERLKRIFY